MSELKPCPFCGGEAFDCTDNSYGDGIIGCAQCEIEPTVFYITGNQDSHKKAIDIWNERIKEIT